MTRAWLRNKFFRERSEENKKKNSKQRNYCVSLLRKPKSDYFGNLNDKNINDNRTFWKTIKPFLSDKVTTNKMKKLFWVTIILPKLMCCGKSYLIWVSLRKVISWIHFFNSKFSYWPLIWMFHSRIINNEINRLHEMCFRLLWNANRLLLKNY